MDTFHRCHRISECIASATKEERCGAQNATQTIPLGVVAYDISIIVRTGVPDLSFRTKDGWNGNASHLPADRTVAFAWSRLSAAAKETSQNDTPPQRCSSSRQYRPAPMRYLRAVCWPARPRRTGRLWPPKSTSLRSRRESPPFDDLLTTL